MNRRTLFAGIAGGAIILTVVAGGGVAVAVVMGQNPPDDSGPVAASVSPVPTTPRPTPTTEPGRTAPAGSLSFAERLRPWRPGDRLVTEQEFRDFHATSRLAGVADASWERLLKENLYAVDCMKKAGFFWDPRHQVGGTGLSTAGVSQAALTALYGKRPYADPYDWRLGGCDGQGAHYSGNDGQGGVPGYRIPGYTGVGAPADAFDG